LHPLAGVRNQAAFLRDELSATKALLEKMDNLKDKLDSSAKNWRDHVNMENCIDDFMHNSDGADVRERLWVLMAREKSLLVG
jgi:hypothetical protein